MKYHELIVHFPIALLTIILLFAVAGVFFRRGLFKEIIFWNLILGVSATGLAIYTGFEERTTITDLQLLETIDLHIRNAYISGGIFFILLLWIGLRKRWMRSLEYLAWISLYAVGTVSIGYQSYIGHEMSDKINIYKMQEIQKKLPVQNEMNYGERF